MTFEQAAELISAIKLATIALWYIACVDLFRAMVQWWSKKP